ncbi:MAG: tetratricopeptide repeat protein [Algibacter sp.]
MIKTFSHICIFVLTLTFGLNAQSKIFNEQLDSIQKLRQLSKNQDSALEVRIAYARQARDLSRKTKIDSISIQCNASLSNLYWKKKLYNAYKDLNKENILLSKKINDSLSFAKSNLNLGEYYRKHTPYGDSAYYHYRYAEKTYSRLKNNYGRAYALYGIAVIYKEEKNYTRSEITSIKVLSILSELKETNDVKKLESFIYNNLGIIFKGLRQYDESIQYYNQSLKLKRELKGDFKINIDYSLNNKALVYEKLGQYNLAIKNYLIIIENKNFLNEGLGSYALVLDNYAHALYLSNNKTQLPKLYLEALNICDSVNATYESIIINQHLAEYYNGENKKDSALYYGYKAKEISKQYYKDDLLKSLLILSKIETDSIAVKHYEAYVNLNDSIQHQERLARNKFARIEFETDQYIEETKRLNTQNILIFSIAGILIITLCLLYFIRRQQDKNKTLLFEKEQQETNQEIYSLMLKQQTKLERVRMQERYRIGDGLHDGILSHLFGTRMGMGFLDLKGDKKTIEDYNIYLDKIQSIEKEVRDVSHQLKRNTALSKTNFESLINQYISQQSLIGGFSCNITNKAIPFDSIDDTIKVNFYRIIQESIQNIIKHAKAKHVTIQFYIETNRLNLVIEDDGIGFDVKASKKGIGLKNMTSRVLNLNGIFKIDSLPNKKTLIHIIIPI